MGASFSIDTDVPRSLVRLTMSGFFDADDMSRFIAARNAAHRRLTCPANQHVTITDVSGMKIQAQDMVVAFQQLLADPAYRSRRLAFVTAPTLARTQLIRALSGRNVRLFGSHAEAEAWVFAPHEDAAAA